MVGSASYGGRELAAPRGVAEPWCSYRAKQAGSGLSAFDGFRTSWVGLPERSYETPKDDPM
jgi:hypothetical protein